MFSRSILIVFLVLLAFNYAAAQDVKIKGKFQRDSLKIGEVIPYSLTARYPSALNVLFPDTTFSFAPFELESKKFFPTRTVNSISYDSAVYFLTTYEIDSVQTLALPAFVIHPGDCTRVDSNSDTITLKQLIKSVSDSVSVEQLPLKTNTDYFNVSWLLNYPLLLIIGGVFIVTLVVLWIIFGKRILRHYRLKKLARNHASFVEKFSSPVLQLQQNFSSAKAELVFVIWKKYMENLVSRPYTNYTSREILRLDQDEKLGKALVALNRIIYAGTSPSSDEPFTNLRDYTEKQYLKKLEEVKHG